MIPDALVPQDSFNLSEGFQDPCGNTGKREFPTILFLNIIYAFHRRDVFK